MRWWRAVVGPFRSRGSARDAEAQTISAAKQTIEARLMAMAGVVSVGIGRAGDGTEVIVVGVDGSRPDLEPRIPKTAGGFAVEIRRIGPLRAH